MNYTNKILKPWGHEYLLYKNRFCEIYHLCIEAGRRTSLHMHNEKTTGLMVISGAASVSFLNSTNTLLVGNKIMLRAGVFHRTTNELSCDLELLEIESPSGKKNNILRLEDDFNRENKKLEFGQTETKAVIPSLSYGKDIKLGNCLLKLKEINDITNCDINDTYFILEGGITTFCLVAGPGDIICYNNFKLLSEKFQLIKPTTVLCVKKTYD